MTLDPDILVDRRRLKRRLSFWRVMAILAVAGLVLFSVFRDAETGASLGITPHIARVNVEGFIGDSRARDRLLKKIAEAKNVSAVLIHVNSPGGTTAGGEALYQDLREVAEKKPVAAVFGTAATSAAYLGGIATDYIVARGNTITGSVGVIFQWAEISDLLDRLGVKVEEIRSGPLKANPSLFKPADEEAKRLSEQLVREAQTWFVDLVAQRRQKAQAALDDIKTGRIYTGRQALSLGLVDAIGDENTAVRWLESERGIAKDLKVIEWKPEREGASGLLQGVASWVLKAAGITAGADAKFLEQVNALKHQPLDGLLSIWHPQLTQ
jgi:protease-4